MKTWQECQTGVDSLNYPPNSIPSHAQHVSHIIFLIFKFKVATYVGALIYVWVSKSLFFASWCSAVNHFPFSVFVIVLLVQITVCALFVNKLLKFYCSIIDTPLHADAALSNTRFSKKRPLYPMKSFMNIFGLLWY